MEEKTALEMLHDMDIRREKKQKSMEDELSKWKVARKNALSEMTKTAGNPDQLDQYIIAEQKLKAATAAIFRLEKELKQNSSKKSNLASHEETADFIRCVNRDALKQVVPLANKMLELESEIYQLSTEISRIERKRNDLIQQWNNEVVNGESDYDTTFHPLPGVERFTKRYVKSEEALIFGSHPVDELTTELREALIYITNELNNMQ